MTTESPSIQPGTHHSNRLWTVAGLSAILLAVLFCAWPGMDSRLFSDDIPQIARSSRFASWTEIFQLDAFHFFRPVKNAVFMIAAPFEKQLFVWHAIGLAAYFAAILGIYRIASICLGAGRPALLAAAIWALSPACVSTAIWLSCANISIGIAIAAAVFHFHEKSAKSGSTACLIAALSGYAGTLLCYEALIAVPGLLFLRDLQQRRLGFNRSSAVKYGLYTLIAIAFLIVRYQFSAKNIGVNDYHAAFAPDTKAIHLSLSAPWFLWRHFLMWVFPFGNIELLGSYAWLRSASAAALVSSWVFLIALLATAAFTWKRVPAISYGILFFVVASIPSGNFLPGFNGPINDAYVTIPSIGLAMIVAVLCVKLLDELAKRRRERDSGVPALAAILILVLVYRLPVCASYFRYWAGVWRNPIQLVLLMSETRPYQFHSKGYAANLLVVSGYIDQAEMLSNEVLRESPWSEWSHLTLARVAGLRGDSKTEEEIYQKLISMPRISEIVMRLAVVELATTISDQPERREEAAQLCRRALNDRHSDPKNHIRAVICLADIYKAQGNTDKARATLEKGIAIHKADGNLTKALAALAHIQAPTPH